MRISFLLSIIIVLSGFSPATAQFTDSLVIKIGTTGTYSNKEFQPLWLTANKFGTIADRGSDLSTRVSIHNLHRFPLLKNDTGNIANAPFYLRYGVQFVNNQHFENSFVQEAFLKTGYKKLEFRAGRYQEITGDIDPELSSGSLGVSGNAIPIPKIGFAITDYVPVPFTKGFFSFKGQISHGWMGDDRYLKGALYHEKIFYMQMGKNKFKLYGGVQHFAEWGGRRGDIQLEKSLKGFLDVLLVREADDGSVGTSTNGLPPNRPGDQRGLLELGFKYENDHIKINGYNQTPFETGRDVDVRNIDRLIGLQFASKKTTGWLQKITAEVLNTKDMLGFVPQFDRQSFYNNGYYKTGWEYQGRIVGTPLFYNRHRAYNFLPQYKPYDWNSTADIEGNSNIVNNRVLALHIGIKYRLCSFITANTVFTTSNNYGTHNPTTPFVPYKKQTYALQQFQFNLPKPGLSIVAAVGHDAGDLYDNTGFLFGIQKQFGPKN